MNLNQSAIRLADLWSKGQETDVIQELQQLSGLTAVAIGALIAIYLESGGEVRPVIDDLAHFNSKIEATIGG